MKKQNIVSLSALTQIRLGGLFLNEAVQKVPENPVWDGDIPQYDGTSHISICDVSAEESAALITWNIVQGMGRWIEKPGSQIMLIADRVLLANVSWNDLARNGFASGRVIKLSGQNFFCHLLPVGAARSSRNGWGDALHTTTSGNDVWHWKGVYFWGENINPEMTRCAVRGNTSAFAWSDSKVNVRSRQIGFRPVLEPMSADANDFLNGLAKKSQTKTQTKTAKKTKQTVSAPKKTKKSAVKAVKKEKSTVVSSAAQMLADALHVNANQEFTMQNQRCIIRPNGALWTFDEKSHRWCRVMDVQQIADMVNCCHTVVETPVFTPEEKNMVNHLTSVFGADWLADKSVQRAKDGSLQIVDGKEFQTPLNREAFPSVKPGQSFPLKEVA